MRLVDLIRLGELDVDQVRADVATLELALGVGRAILAELERADDLADRVAERTASPSVAADAPREHPLQPGDARLSFGNVELDVPAPTAPATIRWRSLPVVDEPPHDLGVRQERQPPETHRAEAPPATPPETPAAPSTPPDSPRPPRGLPDSIAERVRAYLAEHRGEWLAVRTVAEATGTPRGAVSSTLHAGVKAGEYEHNGEATTRGRYRLPAPFTEHGVEPPPDEPTDPTPPASESAASSAGGRDTSTTPSSSTAPPSSGERSSTTPADDLPPLVEPDLERAITTTTDKPPTPTRSREELIARGIIKPAAPDMVRGASRKPDEKPHDHNRPAAGGNTGNGNTIAGTAGAAPPPVSAKTRKALEAEARDGALGKRDVSALGLGILRWLARNGSGTASEIGRSMVRAVPDVALELTTLEQHHGELIERRGRGGPTNAVRYGVTDDGVLYATGA